MNGIRLSKPRPQLEACVVVTARDQERLIGRCIGALAAQRGVDRDAFECILVLDGCRDQTRARALEAAVAAPGLQLHLVEIESRGADRARRIGMDQALGRLEAVGRPDGLIATLEADMVAEPDWLRGQLRALADGSRAVVGAPARAPVLRAATAPRISRAERQPSIGLSASVYLRMRPPGDAGVSPGGLQAALRQAGVPVVNAPGVRVRSIGASGHPGRSDAALAAWLERRSYPSCELSLAELAERKTASVSVVIPAREVAGTIGGIVRAVRRFLDAGVIDELVVVDAASADGTARVAARGGARVEQESELLAGFGPCRGKGDAMWRALSTTSGDIVAYLDGDTEDFHERFLSSMLAPLFEDPTLELVKGAFARPFRAGDHVVPHGGGRVTELMARPLLNLYRPELAGFHQPLAGEVAARRPLLESLEIPVGYGVEIAMMIDAAALVGVDAMAQADLGTRQNRHQSLRSLSAMAYAVLVAASRRLHGDDTVAALSPGRLALPLGAQAEIREVAVDERPAIRDVVPAWMSLR